MNAAYKIEFDRRTNEPKTIEESGRRAKKKQIRLGGTVEQTKEYRQGQ